MQGAVIPFLKQIVETETDARDELIGKLVQVMWGLMEVCISPSCFILWLIIYKI